MKNLYSCKETEKEEDKKNTPEKKESIMDRIRAGVDAARAERKKQNESEFWKKWKKINKFVWKLTFLFWGFIIFLFILLVLLGI